MNQLAEISVEAGLIAMRYYNKSYSIKSKDDRTPVTEADLAVNKFIIESLKRIYPDIPVLSEENSEQENSRALESGRLFIIDPIDGTEAFIEKRAEFTINIGLIENNEFKLGFVYVPRLDILYYNDYQNAYKVVNASTKNSTTTTLSKECKETNFNKLVIATSHKQNEIALVEEDLAQIDVKVEKFLRPSSSYKFCLVAEGTADLYLRRGNMKIWDIAASMAILSITNKPILDSNNNHIDFKSVKNNSSIPFFNVFASKKLVALFSK